MKVQFTHRNVQVAASTKDKIVNKFSDLIERYATKPDSLTLKVDRNKSGVHCQVWSIAGDGFNLNAVGHGETTHLSIEDAFEKLAVQLAKKKERLKDHRGVLKISDYKMRKANNAAQDPQGQPIDAEDLLRYEQARRRLFA
jgi:ribosomal subunit interface protein